MTKEIEKFIIESFSYDCGKHIYLGRFETKELAHDYYIRAAEKYFGQFARTE